VWTRTYHVICIYPLKRARIIYATSSFRLERKDHVCSRPLIPRLPLSQNISKTSQTRNQPTTNISTLTNTRRRPTNSDYRASNYNPFNHNCNNNIHPFLYTIQKQGTALLCGTCTTQPNRRLRNRRRNPNALANNVFLVRIWNPHTKPNKHNPRMEQLPSNNSSNAQNKRPTKTTKRSAVTPISFRAHLNSLTSLIHQLSPFSSLGALNSTSYILSSIHAANC